MALLIADIAVMLFLAAAMLSAARLYFADRAVTKPVGQATRAARGASRPASKSGLL